MSIKPVGAQVLIKIKKKKSSIELLPGTSNADTEAEALVEAVGTTCTLGLEKGHQVMFKSGTMPVVVEESEDFDMLIVPEVSILYIKNWTDESTK